VREVDATGNSERTAGRVGARGAGKINTDLLMLVAVLIWGINFTAVKIAVTAMAPMAFNSTRFALATVVTFGVLAWQTRASGAGRPFRVPVRDAGRIILLGLAGHGIYQILFGNGMARTAPGNASLLMATSPIWVAILGYLLHIERINRVMALGILVSFAGISLVVLGGGKVELSTGTLLGDAMILACAMLWAVYTVSSKPLLGRYSPLEMTAWTMLAGTVVLVGASIPQLRSQDWSAVPPLVWGAIVYSAVLSVTVGYVLYSTSVQRVGNARTAVYSNLTPIVAILFAWITLGDKLTVLQLAGGAIVLTGLLVTRRGRAR
jgi:drug/metabolite transporter (DMT)-like permease